MAAVDISRFTIAKPSVNFWHSTKETLKQSCNIIFGCLCLVVLTFMGFCCTRSVNSDSDKDVDQVTRPEESGDLESQRTHEPIGQVVQQKSNEETTRETERHSHANGNERLSITKRDRETDLSDTSSAVQQDGEVQPESSIQKIKKPEPSPVPATTTAGGDRETNLSSKPSTVQPKSSIRKIKKPQSSPVPVPADAGGVIAAPKRTRLLSSSGEEGSSKKLKSDEVDVSSPRQQLVFIPPARLRTASIPSIIRKGSVSTPSEHAAQIESRYDGSTVTEVQQDHRNEADNVNDGVHDEVHKSTPSTPFTLQNETTRRFFMSRADAYTEKEIIGWSRLLASRISTLSAHLIGEIVRCKPGSNTQHSETRHANGVERRIVDLVKRGLGTHLYAELVGAGQKGEESSIDDISAFIHDSLDAWGTFCIHLAMKPILFGLSLRTIDEIESIFRKMVDHDQELARCWNQIRYHSVPPPREIDQAVSRLVEGMPILQQTRQKDKDEYAILEHTYQRDLANSEYGRQFALHWRGLLQKYELGLPSYKKAIKQTEEVLARGILQIFSIAGAEQPQEQDFRDKVEKIVQEAAALAERTRTGIFSQTVEIVVVDPGRPFDGEAMVAAEGDSNEVKCTLQFGLEVVDCDGQRRTLVLPEVLLV